MKINLATSIKMDQFFERQKLQKLTQEETDNLNKPCIY